MRLWLLMALGLVLGGCGPTFRETYSVSFDDSMSLKDRQLATLQCQNQYNNCSRLARIELQNCELLRANQYQIAYLSCLNQRGDDDEDHCRWLATMNTFRFCEDRQSQCQNELYQCYCLNGASVTITRQCVSQCDEVHPANIITQIPICINE